MDDLDRVFERVSNYFGLLSEPTRLKILHALCDGERPVNAIVEIVGSSQTNVSRHLGAMYRAGILARRKDSNQVFYSIADQGAVDLCRTVCIQIASRLEETTLTPEAVEEFMPQSVPE
jgi:DNA-binding transcriptional ArsR family regulator